MRKNRKTGESGFTLVEMLVSVVLTGIILTSAYAGFQGIMKSQIRLSGVINIQKNLFYLNEKLALLIHSGGTVDYEEYFNRRVLGYGKSFVGNTWAFTAASKYGNGSSSGKAQMYYCVKDSNSNEDACLGSNAVSSIQGSPTGTVTLGGKQMAYGQYREIGFNYGSLAGFAAPIKLPPIFPKNDVKTSQGLSELYLIAPLPDGSYKRTFFRHILIQDPVTAPSVIPCNPASGNTDGCLGKIQMAQLVSCDIIGNDGVADVWVPTSDFGGKLDPCQGLGVSQIKDAANTLTWIDITSPDMDVIKAQFLPNPLKLPSRMAGAGEIAYSPQVQIHLEVRLSEKVMRRGRLSKELNYPRILTTTFDLDEEN